MTTSKKSRHRRSQYRVTTAGRSLSDRSSAGTIPIPPSADPAATNATASQQPTAAAHGPQLTAADPIHGPDSSADFSAPDEEVVDAPTIILTPELITHLAASTPTVTEETGYAFAQPVDLDAPTIVLDIAALMATQPPLEVPTHVSDATVSTMATSVENAHGDMPLTPQVELPTHASEFTVSTATPDSTHDIPPLIPHLPATPPDASIASARPDSSWPRPAVPTPRPRITLPNMAAPLPDPEEEFARLREQRITRAQAEPEENPIATRFQQWWQDLQPGIDRVLGRTHRGGARGARATTYHTSAHMPAISSRSLSEDAAPELQRRSSAAQQVGARAQTAAMPALTRLHERAEKAAQQFVDRIDEHMGGRPPMQHVLLGPGRMIVSFAPSISIRDAQIIIAAVQARALRRLVGYNAYLVLVPPGRESRYAERFHGYREVTGVHFGPQRPSANASTGGSVGRIASGL